MSAENGQHHIHYWLSVRCNQGCRPGQTGIATVLNCIVTLRWIQSLNIQIAVSQDPWAIDRAWVASKDVYEKALVITHCMKLDGMEQLSVKITVGTCTRGLDSDLAPINAAHHIYKSWWSRQALKSISNIWNIFLAIKFRELEFLRTELCLRSYEQCNILWRSVWSFMYISSSGTCLFLTQ